MTLNQALAEREKELATAQQTVSGIRAKIRMLKAEIRRSEKPTPAKKAKVAPVIKPKVATPSRKQKSRKTKKP